MEKQSLALRPAKITIAQERLNIQTDLSDQELEKILEYLNRKIEKYIGENTNETKKRLLLMALDISAEFFDVPLSYSSYIHCCGVGEYRVCGVLLSKCVDLECWLATVCNPKLCARFLYSTKDL